MSPSTGMLELGALETTPLEEVPYRWGYLRSAVAPEAAEALRTSFPEAGFWRLRRPDEETPMDFRIRPLVVLGADAVAQPDGLAEPWLRFADELLAPSYRRAMSRALGVALDDALLEATIWRWGADAHLGVHPDIPRKIASQVFYFNDTWDPAWGGCLRILRSTDPEDYVAELPPTAGSASLVVRSESSWHVVQRVRGATAERLSVVATWQHPQSTSPFWTVGGDGSVTCHARGASRVP